MAARTAKKPSCKVLAKAVCRGQTGLNKVAFAYGCLAVVKEGLLKEGLLLQLELSRLY